MAAARSMRRDKETAMDGVERLLAIEEIKTLFARRLRYMDLGKWDRYGSCHTADAWSETYGDLPLDKQQRSADGQSNRVVGPEALANQIRYFMTHNHLVPSANHSHPPEINRSEETKYEIQ